MVNKVTWRGKVGMWLLGHQLPTIYRAWSWGVKAYDAWRFQRLLVQEFRTWEKQQPPDDYSAGCDDRNYQER